MLPKFEYDSLYKFLVSAGLLLVAASILTPWVILRDNSILLLTTEQIEQLPQASQGAIEFRQDLAARLGEKALWIAVLGGILGLGVAVVGIVLWLPVQRVVNRTQILQMEKLHGEVRQLTDAEKAEVGNQEAVATIGAEAITPAQTPYRSQVSEVRERYGLIEASLLTELRMMKGTRNVRDGVAITTPGRRHVVDAVLEYRGRDIVVEIKYIRSYHAARQLLPRSLFDLGIATERYRNVARRPAVGLLVVVIETELTEGSRFGVPARAWMRAFEDLNAMIGAQTQSISTVVFRADELVPERVSSVAGRLDLAMTAENSLFTDWELAALYGRIYQEYGREPTRDELEVSFGPDRLDKRLQEATDAGHLIRLPTQGGEDLVATPELFRLAEDSSYFAAANEPRAT